MNGFSTGEEDSRGAADQICCLVDDGQRCSRPASNASYNKRIQKQVTQKKLKLNLDNQARHIYICDYHKQLILCARSKHQQRRRKDSEEDSGEMDTDMPEVDLFQLQIQTLRRYKRHYRLPTKPGLNNKAQMVDTIMKHFRNIPISEKEILSYFFYTVKTNANKLDQQKNGLNNDTT